MILVSLIALFRQFGEAYIDAMGSADDAAVGLESREKVCL